MSALPYVRDTVIPVTLSLLQPRLDSKEARAMLIAIGLQESLFEYRRQSGGPARGYWQFESGGGVAGVLRHPASSQQARAVLAQMGYGEQAILAYEAIEHNDILACALARLLLFTLPQKLPGPQEVDRAWGQYLEAWRPGKPHADAWALNYAHAWRDVG